MPSNPHELCRTACHPAQLPLGELAATDSMHRPAVALRNSSGQPNSRDVAAPDAAQQSRSSSRSRACVFGPQSGNYRRDGSGGRGDEEKGGGGLLERGERSQRRDREGAGTQRQSLRAREKLLGSQIPHFLPRIGQGLGRG